MSKINAVRLINLNYNNNAIRISDEIFHLNGESTLLSLRNGGGKSVLVQMMMAPFVHKRYRDAKDRPFESYFTTAKPTFILVEWVLDQGAGYVLTGMMVRKSQDVTEGSGENLEIVNVISEYKKRCMQDIYNLPVVEKTKKEVRLKGFGACRQLFETYKKDSSMKFFCYDMSNTAQSKQYFDRLREYQINYKEWETIIKKINLKESGLSDLFADCRDEKGLVEKWFLDAVESKLNKEKNRMREFQNIIQKYAGQYKDNKSKIERRDTIRQFREQAVRIEESIRSYENAGNEQRSCENRIAAFIAELKRLDDSIAQEIENLQTQIEELQRQIFHVEYEQISGDIHRLKREARNVESNRDMIDMERDGLQREYDRITHKLHVFAVAKQSGQVRIRQEEWQELEQKLEVSRRKQEELEPERNYLGYTLKMHYERELEKNRQREINNGSEQEKAKEQILDGNQRLRDIQEQMSKLHEDIGIYQGLLRNFSEKEDAFNRYYQENFVRNILGEYEPGMLDICRETYEKQQEQLSRNRIQYKRDLENCTERERSTKRAIEDGKRDLSELANERTLAQQRLSGYEAQLGERKNILRYLDIPEQDLFDRDKILMSCYRKLEELGAERRRLEQEEDVLQKEYVKLTQGKVLELTPEFEEMLKTLGLNYIYGMEWLQRNGRPAKENRALVKSHPFLPYALILSSGDLKKLETHAGDVYTSTPVPIVLREQLDRTGISESSPVLSFEDVNFYLLFNENLLDEEMLARLVAEKEAFQIQNVLRELQGEYQIYERYERSAYEAALKTGVSLIGGTRESGRNADSAGGEKPEISGRSANSAGEETPEISGKSANSERTEKTGRDVDTAGGEMSEMSGRSVNSAGGEKPEISGKSANSERTEKTGRDIDSAGGENTGDFGEIAGVEVLVNSGEITRDELIRLKTRYQAITRQISGERQELERNLIRAKERYDSELDELKHLEQKFGLQESEYHDVFTTGGRNPIRKCCRRNANGRLRSSSSSGMRKTEKYLF